MKRQTKKVPRLDRRLLEKMLADLVERLRKQGRELEAIQHFNRPNDEHVVIEIRLRTAFGIALDHQANSLRNIAGFAEMIHEQAAGTALTR